MTDKHEIWLGQAFRSVVLGESPDQAGEELARQLRAGNYSREEALRVGRTGYLPRVGDYAPNYTTAEWEATVRSAYSSPPPAEEPEIPFLEADSSPPLASSDTSELSVAPPI